MTSELVDEIMSAIEAATEPLFARIKALEADVAALKGTPQAPPATDPQAIADAVRARLR